jgi:dihydrofolate reductase
MRLTVISHLTLDGVMQSNGKPEPELDHEFQYGGWQVPYLDDDLFRLVAGWLELADAFLFGRTTYDLFNGHWSKITDPSDILATRLNSLPKYIASSTLERVDWANSHLIRGDLFEQVARLKNQPGRELQVHGSAALVAGLMERELIDEYRLFIHPVVLGAGRRLFTDGITPTALQLLDTNTTAGGVAVHVYRPIGKPLHGAMGLAHEGEVVKAVKQS